MKILEINLRTFGGLKNRNWVLSDGLNLFEGDNESGKSTVLLFLQFMLYGMPRKGQEGRLRAVSWTEHCADGALTVLFGEEVYRIERSFVENGRSGTERLQVYRTSDGKECFAGQVPGEVFFGVPREVFESSAAIGQMKSDATGGKKGAEAIRNLLSAADETADISKIEEKLDKIRVAYRHKTGRKGILADLSDDIHTAQGRWERAETTQSRLSELEQSAERIRVQYEELQKKSEMADETLRQSSKADLLCRFDALRQKKAELATWEQETEDFLRDNLKTSVVPDEHGAAELASVTERLEEAEKHRLACAEDLSSLQAAVEYDERLSELGEKLNADGGVERISEEIRHAQKKKRLYAQVAVLALLAGAVGVLSGVFWHLVWLCFVCGIGGVAVFGVAWGRRIGLERNRKRTCERYGTVPAEAEAFFSSCAKAWEKKQAYRASLSEHEEQLRAADRQVAEAGERLAKTLRQTLPSEQAVPDVSVGRAEVERLRRFLEQKRQRQMRSEILRQRISEETERLSAYDEEGLRSELTLAGIDPTAVNLQQAEREQKMLRNQLESVAKKKNEVEIERISLRANAEDPMKLADELSTLQEKAVRAEEYYDAVEMALSALHDASEAMSGEVTPILGKRAGEMMSFLSDGRYSELYAGQDFVPSLGQKDGFRVSSDLFSGGTKDMAYFALRLALTLQIFEKEKPPLLLDESFCQTDNRRTERALMLVSRLCENQILSQCLLFSCQSREAEICRKQGIPYHSIQLT